MPRSPSLAALVLVLATGCARTYRPDPPKVAHFPDMNAAVAEVRIGSFVAGFDVFWSF